MIKSYQWQALKDPNSRQSIRLGFSGIEFFFWAACSAYYPFFVVLLQDRQFSNTTIGLIMAVNSAIVVLAQPFWGFISDWIRSVKKVIILCLSAASLLLLSLPFLQTAVIIGLLAAFITFFESPIMSLLDSWLVRGIQDLEQVSYGVIRFWGSIGFAIMVLVAGKVVDTYGINYVFIIYGISAVITILFCLRQKDTQPLHTLPLKQMKVGQLLKNPAYVSFVALATLLFIPHRAAIIFLPNLMAQVNGTSQQYGFAFTVAALSEVPVFMFAGRFIRKVKPRALILISLIFFVLRQVLYMTATTPAQVILGQLMHGMSFALFLNGSVYYVYEMAPDHLKATAQTFATSMFFGLSGIIGGYAGGFIIDRFGLYRFYQICVGSAMIAALLFVLQLLLSHKTNRPQKEAGS